MTRCFQSLRHLLLVCAIAALRANLALAGPGGELTIEVIDRETKAPLPCRMHLWNAAKKPLKAPKVPFWHDHFVFDGQIVLKLPKGEYGFEIERGPEYLVRSGHFSMDDFSRDTKVVDLKRFVDMAKEGWWSGDLDVERPAKEMEQLMVADDLHIAELVTWPFTTGLVSKQKPVKSPLIQFDGNRFFHQAAGRDNRSGGSLLYFNLPAPFDMPIEKDKTPVPLESLTRAKTEEAGWADAAKLYSWDLPILIASGKLDSVQLASRDLGRSFMAKSEGQGRPRDKQFFAGPMGLANWSEAIYFHLLNCGLRLPPTAGSGSGEVNNPLGYNRVYVHVDGELTYEKWWAGLRQGQVLITNGPLIRPTVEGELPGHVFSDTQGNELELEMGLQLAARDKVSYLEVIRDGQVVHNVRLADWVDADGKLPKLNFKQSGWFLVRVVAEVPETHRFAMTAPYYVQIGPAPRISKTSAQFFLTWLDERTKKLEVADAGERAAILEQHEMAHDYWQDLVERSNAP